VNKSTRFLLKLVVFCGNKVVGKVSRLTILRWVVWSMENRQISIRFFFDREKFVTAMQILCRRTDNLDMLKAVKLLYFIDREHLRTYGRPVLGDYYVAMPLGPVPSQSYDALKMVQAGEASDIPLTSKDVGRRYPVFDATKDPDFSYLSKSELRSVENVIKQFGDKSGTELSDIAHKHQTWKKSKPDPNTPPSRIDYTSFFAEEPDACKNAYEAMLLEQEERDFAGGI